MNKTKLLPLAAAALAIPGIGLRALHLLNGFDVDSGLPTAGSPWVWVCAVFFVLCAVLYGVLTAPLREKESVPFEKLLGTDHALFRMTAVIAGLLLIAGSAGYLCFTFTAQEEGAALWSHVLEIVYSITGIGSGVCMIAFTKAQGASYMTSDAAKCVLLPLFWSALHLLVNYRMTCTDPRLQLFAFGLLADVMLVLAFYQIARLLYGRPQPMLLALFGALAAVMSFSDLGGYGLARLMGVTSVAWPARCCCAAACRQRPASMCSRSFSCCARETQITRNEEETICFLYATPNARPAQRQENGWKSRKSPLRSATSKRTTRPRRSCATGTAAAVCRSSGFSIRAAFSTRRSVSRSVCPK